MLDPNRGQVLETNGFIVDRYQRTLPSSINKILRLIFIPIFFDIFVEKYIMIVQRPSGEVEPNSNEFLDERNEFRRKGKERKEKNCTKGKRGERFIFAV